MLGYGGGRYHSRTHFVCHYLGVCGQNRGGAESAYFLQYLKYRAGSVMRGEFGIEDGETIFRGGKAPPEAVSGRATYTTAAAKSAAIYSRLGVNAVTFQTPSMLLQASCRVFP